MKNLKKIKGDASFRKFYRKKGKNNNSIIVLAKKEKIKNLIIYEAIKDYGFKNSLKNIIRAYLQKKSGKLFYSKHYRLLVDRDKLIINKINNSQSCIESLEKQLYKKIPLKKNNIENTTSVFPRFSK